MAIAELLVGVAIYLLGRFIAEETPALNTGKTIGFAGLALAAAPIIAILCEAPR